MGESGCGKTTAGRSIVRLIEPTKGTVTFDGQDMGSLSAEQLRLARKRLQVIFQDPHGSIDPRWTIESILTEGMKIHGIGAVTKPVDKTALSLMAEVGLPGEDLLNRYPHEFSRATAANLYCSCADRREPDLIICDESVSALDVSVQAQVLNLLKGSSSSES